MSQRLKQLDRIAEGAQAEICRGELMGERGTFRQVAIKRLREGLRTDPKSVDLFVHEARIALQVNHPNLTRAIELGRDDDGYYLVCEWVQGLSVAALLNRAGPAPWTAAVRIGEAVCEGLAHLHSLAAPDGTPLCAVHRDVTPANILVSADAQIQLADFGIASYANGVPLAAAGTPGFAAPEQAAGGAIRAATDVFGLGRTLQAVAGELPTAVAEVLKRATAVDQVMRYATATELRQALAEASAKAGATESAGALREWYERGRQQGTERAPTRLDGAVRSVLGSALEAREPAEARLRSAQPSLPRTTASRTPWHLALAALAAASCGAVLFVAYVPARQRTEPPPVRRQTSPGTALGTQLAVPLLASPAPDAPGSSGTTGTDAQLARGAAPGGRAPTAQPLDGSRPPTQRPPARTARPFPEQPEREAVGGAAGVQTGLGATGTVRLNAVPWAHVRLDGRPMGSTPLRAIELKSGPHRLELHYPPEKLRFSVVIDVTARAVQTIVVDLRHGTVDKRVE